MLSFQTLPSHQGLKASEHFSSFNFNIPDEKYESMNPREHPFLTGIHKDSNGVGVLRISPFLEEVEADLIYTEIQNLNENCKAQGMSKLPAGFKAYSYESSDLDSERDTPSPKKSYKKQALIKSMIGTLSPRLSKKVKVKEMESPPFSSSPVWPNSMSTYSRGVSVNGTLSLVSSPEPSLAAFRIQPKETNKVKSAIESLEKTELEGSQVEEKEEHHAEDEDEEELALINFNAMENQKNNSNTNVTNNNNNSILSEPSKPIPFNRNTNYYGQSPFDDDFDPSIHKPNVNLKPKIVTFETQEFYPECNTQSEWLQTKENQTKSLPESIPTKGNVQRNSLPTLQRKPEVRVYNNYLVLTKGAPTDSVFV